MKSLQDEPVSKSPSFIGFSVGSFRRGETCPIFDSTWEIQIIHSRIWNITSIWCSPFAYYHNSFYLYLYSYWPERVQIRGDHFGDAKNRVIQYLKHSNHPGIGSRNLKNSMLGPPGRSLHQAFPIDSTIHI